MSVLLLFTLGHLWKPTRGQWGISDFPRRKCDPSFQFGLPTWNSEPETVSVTLEHFIANTITNGVLRRTMAERLWRMVTFPQIKFRSSSFLSPRIQMVNGHLKCDTNCIIHLSQGFALKWHKIHYNIPPLHKWEVQDVEVSFCSNLLGQVTKALFEWLSTSTSHNSVLLWWYLMMSLNWISVGKQCRLLLSGPIAAQNS